MISWLPQILICLFSSEKPPGSVWMSCLFEWQKFLTGSSLGTMIGLISLFLLYLRVCCPSLTNVQCLEWLLFSYIFSIVFRCFRWECKPGFCRSIWLQVEVCNQVLVKYTNTNHGTFTGLDCVLIPFIPLLSLQHTKKENFTNTELVSVVWLRNQKRYYKLLHIASVVLVGLYSPLNCWGCKFQVNLTNASFQMFIWSSALFCQRE